MPDNQENQMLAAAFSTHRSGNLPEAARLYRKVIKQNPKHHYALHLLGVIEAATGNLPEAAALMTRSLAAPSPEPQFFQQHATVMMQLGRYGDALASVEKVISLNSQHAESYVSKGALLNQMGRHADAIVQFETGLRLKPNLANGWLGCGNALRALKRYGEATVAYDKAIALNPNLTGAKGYRFHSKMAACDWSTFENDVRDILRDVRGGKPASAPFTLLSIPSTAADQIQCAKTWAALKHPPRAAIWCGERYKHSKIRIGYLSADFQQHATANLIAGMLEHHDKTRFETTAIILNPNDRSSISGRMRATFDHTIEAEELTDTEVATRIRRSEIDILVDMKGFTQNARTDILAHRPAPIQVNYLGYPGAMGVDYIDYIIADSTIIPEGGKQFYSGKVAHLPNSYQPNDRARPISDRVFTRDELGLPPAGFVFCCFNNSYKITPDVFDRWMRILRQVEGSVLWLLQDNAIAAANLRKEATSRGVDARRLVFAERASLPDHLARHAYADLFLGTTPCNAHTTASDALWAGLPVLTCPNGTFAGSVAASLVKAAGIPEMVMGSMDEYERTAVDLVRNPEKLNDVKNRLAVARNTCPLFDTAQYTRDIEAAFSTMHERQKNGLPPTSFAVN